MDVNFNRATEGLRVVEEIARFVIEDKKITLAVKTLREELSRAIRSSHGLLGARKALEDVGRVLYTRGEGSRADLESIFKANIKRAQEAIRCLEEFSKLIDPALGKKFKRMRFKLYDIETKMSDPVAKADKLDFDLYVVTDPKAGPLKTIRRALAAGVKIVQLRDKNISKDAYFRLAKKAAAIIKKTNTVFILNDYWDMVGEVGADGVHLGQEDLKVISIKKVRNAIGNGKLIGISTHSYRQAERAVKLGADYISVGPIFATPSKPGREPVGLNLLKKAVNRIKIPVVAIGGINRSNATRVIKAGGHRVAVIRAASEAKSIIGLIR